jgi:hypothetical protein
MDSGGVLAADDADEQMLVSCKTTLADHNQEAVPIPDEKSSTSWNSRPA